MGKKKYKHAKTTGNTTESIVEAWFKALNMPCERENTMLNTRTRNKGSVDFVGDTFAIEVKHFTGLLTFKAGSEQHDLHWSQIGILNKARLNGKIAAILITENDIDFLFIRIESFLNWYRNNSRKSINFEIGKTIGYIVRNEKDLKRVMEMEG